MKIKLIGGPFEGDEIDVPIGLDPCIYIPDHREPCKVMSPGPLEIEPIRTQVYKVYPKRRVALHTGYQLK